jgi:hypothetical protein
MNNQQDKRVPRRRFIRDMAASATLTCLTPTLFPGCQSALSDATPTPVDSDAMDHALEMMTNLAPLTNHGPMAAEALIELGRGEDVVRFVEAYRKRFTDLYPPTVRVVTTERWREALGDGRRVADWSRFFQRELDQSSWKQVLEQWSSILAPGLSAAAGHGLLRAGHAVRSLALKETALRRRELAEGLAYWAAYYQPLPESPQRSSRRLKPSEAVSKIPHMPAEKRAVNGSLMKTLQNLDHFPPFASTADLIDSKPDPVKFLSEITEAFARVYVTTANRQNFISLIHSVTATTVLRSMLPHVSVSTTQKLLRYGWQLAAALYSISGAGADNNTPKTKEIKRDELIDRAVASREEHAIKFTEACLREHKLNPTPVYLQAADDALERIGRV